MKTSKTFIGRDPKFKVLLADAELVATTNTPVLLCGETGTGKELLAKAIHQKSLRAKAAMISLNCAALPENLVESELFGYMKGAFTGATTNKEGIISAADGGTLFLDEVNSLSITIQPKLLRFLENGEFTPIGSLKPRISNVRIIAASNNDIVELINEGKFREDLYFRLNVFPLFIPPLRDRPKDIEPLLKHYFNYFANKYQVRTPRIAAETLSFLEECAWPGNIRELRNLCEKLTIEKIRYPIKLADLKGFYENKVPVTPPYQSLVLPKEGLNWEEIENRLIKEAMERSNNNYLIAAQLLGISRDKLYYRINKRKTKSIGKKKKGDFFLARPVYAQINLAHPVQERLAS